MTVPEMTHIVACSREGVIGLEGDMPWHIPADLKHFKKHTSGHCMLMGRKTYESIGRALPNRLTIVMSREPSQFNGDRLCGVRSLDEAIRLVLKQKEFSSRELFIVGGGEIYRQTLKDVSRVILTKIDQSFSGDTYYPLDELESTFLQTSSECFEDPLPFCFTEWRARESNL